MSDGHDDPVMDEAARQIWEAGEERLGPAQDRDEALERARAQSPPQSAAIEHGLYLQDGIAMLCGRCPVADLCDHVGDAGTRCPLEIAYIDRRTPQIRTALRDCGQDPDRHEALIMAAVWAEIRLARAARHAAAVGEFTAKRDYTGAAKQIPALQRAVAQALEALNLTPAAIAKLEAQRDATAPQEWAAQIHALDGRAESEGEAVDAEFEEDGDGAPPRR